MRKILLFILLFSLPGLSQTIGTVKSAKGQLSLTREGTKWQMRLIDSAGPVEVEVILDKTTLLKVRDAVETAAAGAPTLKKETYAWAPESFVGEGKVSVGAGHFAKSGPAVLLELSAGKKAGLFLATDQAIEQLRSLLRSVP